MVIIRKKELVNMSETELTKKLEELKLEAMKSIKPAQGTSVKSREVRRTIARILTYIKQKHGNMS